MTNADANQENDSDTQSKPEADQPRRRNILLSIVVLITLALVAGGSYVGYLYAATPVTIRQPLPEHYHFRMQVLVNGKAENFGSTSYQEGYSKDNCSAMLTNSPIHFHDNRDQFVHIHWEGITGGQVLKYYGWNLIGGTKGALGYRFDDKHRMQRVPIHSSSLPAIPNDAQFYTYVRDGDNYKQKPFDDFTHQDLEKFFGITSNYPAHKLNQEIRKSSLLDLVAPRAYAHMGDEKHADNDTTPHADELTRLNNLIGDVAIFVQKDQPSDSQIRDRFSKLEPLTDSSCGG